MGKDATKILTRPRIYADTSVIGGCLDEEFELASRRLMSWFKQGRAILVLSDLTLLELENAPKKAWDFLDEISWSYRESVALDDQAMALALRYIREGVVTAGQSADARHIAVATLSRVDVLVSWNFKHIVNLGKIRGYNSINLRLGLPSLEIRSPLEVKLDEKET